MRHPCGLGQVQNYRRRLLPYPQILLHQRNYPADLKNVGERNMKKSELVHERQSSKGLMSPWHVVLAEPKVTTELAALTKIAWTPSQHFNGFHTDKQTNTTYPVTHTSSKWYYWFNTYDYIMYWLLLILLIVFRHVEINNHLNRILLAHLGPQ